MILKALKTTLIFKERLSPAYLSAVDLPNQHSSQVYQKPVGIVEITSLYPIMW